MKRRRKKDKELKDEEKKEVRFFGASHPRRKPQ
jgi:hypothetical protein